MSDDRERWLEALAGQRKDPADPESRQGAAVREYLQRRASQEDAEEPDPAHRARMLAYLRAKGAFEPAPLKTRRGVAWQGWWNALSAPVSRRWAAGLGGAVAVGLSAVLVLRTPDGAAPAPPPLPPSAATTTTTATATTATANSPIGAAANLPLPAAVGDATPGTAPAAAKAAAAQAAKRAAQDTEAASVAARAAERKDRRALPPEMPALAEAGPSALAKTEAPALARPEAAGIAQPTAPALNAPAPPVAIPAAPVPALPASAAPAVPLKAMREAAPMALARRSELPAQAAIAGGASARDATAAQAMTVTAEDSVAIDRLFDPDTAGLDEAGRKWLEAWLAHHPANGAGARVTVDARDAGGHAVDDLLTRQRVGAVADYLRDRRPELQPDAVGRGVLAPAAPGTGRQDATAPDAAPTAAPPSGVMLRLRLMDGAAAGTSIR